MEPLSEEEIDKKWNSFLAVCPGQQYDWEAVFQYSKFQLDEIEQVLFSHEGENDNVDWALIARLKEKDQHGRQLFGWVIAGCDYSGWG